MAIAERITNPGVVPSPFLELRGSIEGEVIRPGEDGYEEARLVRQALADRHPSIIVRAAGTDDVARTVRFARELGMQLAVRSGGHSMAGFSVADGAVVLDLSLMKRIDIDPETRVMRVQTGVTSADIAARAQEHGLALSTGDVSSVGIGGLTLGGGIGYMVRKYGLTIDHLRSAQMVTADGEVLQASAVENPDLFWALRGGGGNFGVVTEFEFLLQTAGTVLGGVLILPAAKEVIRGYVDYAVQADEGLSTIAAILQAPPVPFLPEEHHGKVVFAIFLVYAGDLATGEKVVAPLQELAEPIANLVGPMPYPAIYDLTAEATVRGSMSIRSMFMEAFPDEVIDVLLEQAPKATAPIAMQEIRVLGGAMARVPVGATAFSHRDKPYMLTVINDWPDPADTAKHIDWTAETWNRLKGFGKGVYVNFLEDEGDARLREAYSPETFARLAAVKRRYDPTNFFRLNQNIRPQ